MSLYKQWEEIAEESYNQPNYEQFWKEYLGKEQKIYEVILNTKNTKLEGTVKDLAESFGMDSITFAGFLDGINTSLTEELDMESLEETTLLDSTIEWEKLFYNMHDATAEWLYTLEGWDDILTEEKRKEIKKTYMATKTVVKGDKIGRNDPCPCGSGKKYKKCCLK
ncbi:MAG: SEC-C metal-binding domain-containing protein [Acidaminobacteraceae bacterium]